MSDNKLDALPPEYAKAKMRKLQEVTSGVVKYLRENYNPHATIIVSSTHVKVVEDAISIPIEYRED